MKRIAAIIGLGVALAGCSKPAEQQEKRNPPPPPFIRGGWPTIFADAPQTQSLLDRMGFRLTPYDRTGPDSFKSTALPTPMGDPSIKPINFANLTLSGGEKTLSSLVFTLDLVNLDSSPFAKKQFEQWISRPMSQLGLPGADKVGPAIQTEASTTGTVSGARWSVAREKIDGGRRLVVTFTPPEAKSGTSEPRKQ